MQKNKRSNFETALFAVTLDREKKEALHLQLAETLRTLILAGHDLSGLRLPSSRHMAGELSISRMTVTTAYDQLQSEGYLTSRTGAGTFVADALPHLTSPARTPARSVHAPQPWQPFQAGLPDHSLFPHRLWSRCLDRAWRRPDPNLLARPDPFGWFPLRAAISEHLSAWRGLESDPNQIVITSGAWDGFEIICNALLKRHIPVAIEDPGWSPLRGVLSQSRIPVRPIRIDDTGLDAEKIPDGVQAAVVTPSRHYPTGRSMPLAQRLNLLNWAQTHNTLLIEDDYDSEFRYHGQPLPSLSGLDGLCNTLYLGSFSKLFSPTLRLGYLVVPETYLENARAFIGARGTLASLVPQPALATFMTSGEFATHLRRMRRTYAKRQKVLLAALTDVADLIELKPDPSGMHICCDLKPALLRHVTDKEVSIAASQAGLSVRALSSYSVFQDARQGLILGYTAFDDEALTDAAQILGRMLRQLTCG